MKPANMHSAPRILSTRTGAGLALLLAGTVALGGCSTVKGWFGGKRGETLKPAELTEFSPSLKVEKLWSAKAGKGEGLLGARQGPAVADGHVYAAAVEGGVRAFDLRTGNALWHYESDLPLSGGPGVGDGVVVAGSLEGDVVALDASTGAQKWTAKVGSEVIAAPTIGRAWCWCVPTTVASLHSTRPAASAAGSGSTRPRP
jgi:outer membrane protein assembly factor BamB